MLVVVLLLLLLLMLMLSLRFVHGGGDSGRLEGEWREEWKGSRVVLAGPLRGVGGDALGGSDADKLRGDGCGRFTLGGGGGIADSICSL